MSKDSLWCSDVPILFTILGVLFVNTALLAGPSNAPKDDQSEKPQRAGIPVILDTDMDSDVNDVGALAVLHALANNGEAEILGVIVTSDGMHTPLCADAIMA